MIKWLACALFSSLPVAAAWADGAVYAMTNPLANNEILVYHRASNGNLNPTTPVQTIATGGGGSGLQLSNVDSLQSAGGVQLDQDHRFLFAVNTESANQNNGAGTYNTDCQQGTITSFRVAADGTLAFADRVFSGGLFPNSLTVRQRGNGDFSGAGAGGDVLYVLNAGGPEPPAVCNLTPDTANTPNITGFRVDRAGHMIPLDSTQPIDPGPAVGTGVECVDAAGFAALTGAPAADFACGLNPPSFPRSPAQVKFTPDLNSLSLVVTVKGTNAIYVFPVSEDGSVDTPTITQAPGPALPSFFGLTFDKQEHLLVTELFGSSASIPNKAAGAVSSFTILDSRHLLPISSHVPDFGTAACWIALEPKTGKYAFVSNNLSATISSYSVGSNGSVTLLNGSAATPSGPNDLATATEGGKSFLYVVAAGSGTVGAFKINLTNGVLTALTGSSVFPGFTPPQTTFPQGIAAF
jgi:6-phosphogluconolactonase (cycloisomerase 2 family)